MGEIAEMMLDGTMDPETGEFNFDGEDGPGWPMTGAQAAAYQRATSWKPKRPSLWSGAAAYKLTKSWRKKIEKFGGVRANDFYHWQVRKDGQVLADWWPHRGKWRIGKRTQTGTEGAFLCALQQSVEAKAHNAAAREASS